MANFVNNSLTHGGERVLVAGQTGKQIRYTRLVMGDGYMLDTELPEQMEAVIHPVVSLEIKRCKPMGAGQFVVGGDFDNSSLEKEFYYRELGLYVEDPDAVPDAEGKRPELLYAYGNAGMAAELIRPSAQSSLVAKAVDVIVYIGRATDVTAYFANDIYAMQTDFEKHLADMTVHLTPELVALIYQDHGDIAVLQKRIEEHSSIVVIPEGEDVPVGERKQNCFYIRVTDEKSTVPDEVRASPNMALKLEDVGEG